MRTRSAMIITRRFTQRSTQAPANRPTTRNAAVPAAPRIPISPSVAFSRTTATTVIAKPPSCEPMTERVWAVNSQAKRGLRKSIQRFSLVGCSALTAGASFKSTSSIQRFSALGDGLFINLDHARGQLALQHRPFAGVIGTLGISGTDVGCRPLERAGHLVDRRLL